MLHLINNAIHLNMFSGKKMMEVAIDNWLSIAKLLLADLLLTTSSTLL